MYIQLEFNPYACHICNKCCTCAQPLLVNAEGDPDEWPGPKAWPASLILVSFFSVNICFQALLKALDPVVLDNVPALNWLSLLQL